MKGMFDIIKTKDREDQWALAFVLLYLVLACIWHFASDSPWDDDCVARYFNARRAMNDPSQFINLWNRPLFMLLFVLPYQLGKHAVLLVGVLSAVSSLALYRAVKDKGIQHAFLVLPFLLFQSYFFIISRSSLAEPVASALICFGFYFLVRKKYLAFAIAGSLLPLARLEMSLFLLIWAIPLLREKKWMHLMVLGVPIVLWSIAGTIIEGGALWLVEQTVGKENEANPYGRKSFWHYFQRYIFVIGPVVFYLFFIGLLDRLFRRKLSLFIWGQFALGFMIYVIFSWKLDMGKAAGFLRHLIVLSPMAALLALHGFNAWLRIIRASEFESQTEEQDIEHELQSLEVRARAEGKKGKELRRLMNMEKKALEKQKEETLKEASRVKRNRSRQLILLSLYSVLISILTYVYLSHPIASHHKILDSQDLKHFYIVTGLSLLFILLVLLPEQLRRKLGRFSLLVIITLAVMSYTMLTEPPNTNDSPERMAMGSAARLYADSYLSEQDVYVNHPWFFWTIDIVPDREIYPFLTKENMQTAADSSIFIWESHYSHRLNGDVTLPDIFSAPNFVELSREVSTDGKFMVCVYQKHEALNSQGKLALSDEFVDKFPNRAGAYVSRATIHFNSFKNFDQAISDYDKAIQLDSNNIEAWTNKGLAYFNKRAFPEARASLEHSIGIRAKNHQALAYLGMCQWAMGEKEEAIESYSASIAAKKDQSKVYFDRAVAYTMMKNYDKAIKDFQEHIRYKGSSTNDALYNIGLILFEQKKNAQACAILGKARDNGHPKAAALIQQRCGQPVKP